MADYKYLTKEEILHRGQEIIGIPFGEIDKTNRLKGNKGGIGQMVEENWFGYSPNSDANADFKEAGVELKVSPYIIGKTKIRAKERLVCTIIDYMKEWDKVFETSKFWEKNETILLMSYQYVKGIPKTEYTIDKVILFSFPEADLMIIKQDWEKIMQKVRNGEAHLLSEGDTLYLGACTKGANSESMRPQPFSDIQAKQRAYSLKQSYMTTILNKYIFGNETDEHIIKDWHDLQTRPFEGIIIDRLKKYYNYSQTELKKMFELKGDSKNINELLVSKMLGVKGKVSKTAEFQNADITPKTIRVQKSGKVKESMSFPNFKFTELIKEDVWEDSDLYNQLAPKKFLFIIFQEREDGEYYFDRAMFWNIPYDDLEEVHKVWLETKRVIEEGVQIIEVNNKFENNLPKQRDNEVSHVRPHTNNRYYKFDNVEVGNPRCGNELPDGRWMTKQCFWLNNTYIALQVKNNE